MNLCALSLNTIEIDKINILESTLTTLIRLVVIVDDNKINTDKIVRDNKISTDKIARDNKKYLNDLIKKNEKKSTKDDKDIYDHVNSLVTKQDTGANIIGNPVKLNGISIIEVIKDLISRFNHPIGYEYHQTTNESTYRFEYANSPQGMGLGGGGGCLGQAMEFKRSIPKN